MNETISIILATTILAISGLGLYMYKSSDSLQKDYDENNNEDYNENNFFNNSLNSLNFFNWRNNDNDNDNDNSDNDNEDDYDYKSYKKGGSKTQKNKKTNGTSKRRH
jgi:hypothetical protein